MHSNRHGDDDLEKLRDEASKSGALDLQDIIVRSPSHVALGPRDMDLESLVSPLSMTPERALTPVDDVASEPIADIYCPPNSAVLQGVDFRKVRDLVTQLKKLDPDFDGSPYSDGEDEMSDVGGENGGGMNGDDDAVEDQKLNSNLKF